MTQDALSQWAHAQQQQLSTWRRHFHQYPEPSLKEFQTAATIRNILEQAGIHYQPIGETGTLAVVSGTKGASTRTLFLRADIDALELPDKTGTEYASKNDGMNHACGHDAHTAIGLGVATWLQHHRDQFSGTVKIGFQQAEEIGAGARQFVAAGALDDVTEVFGLHMRSSLPVGTISAIAGPIAASCDIFTITLTGRSTHVGTPHCGNDAVVAAAALVLALQTIVAREVNPFEPAVVGIGVLQAGTRYNIVAGEARLEGTVRAFSQETRQQLLSAVARITADVAQTYRVTHQFSNYDAAAPVVNTEASAQRAARVAATVAHVTDVRTAEQASMGADDFADYLLIKPGVYTHVGSQSSEATAFSHHHEQFDIDERALVIGTEYSLRYVLDFLAE